MQKRALISVFDKEGVAELASFLAGADWELLSTGGTAKHLASRGLAVTEVSAVTGFPECLDGRVKTLHPAIHGGLLARRNEASHMETLEKLGIGPIDLVCVNLYPFFEKVRAGLSPEETIEFIDIGGPSMLRSAAKNYRDVIVLTDPADYGGVIAALQRGRVPEDIRKGLAAKVFALTSAYDAAVARYLLGDLPDSEPEFPSYWPRSLKRAQVLRYGENGHQRAALYHNADAPGAIGAMVQLHGKELSYNNIRDLDLAWKAVCAFGLPADGFPPQGAGDPAVRELSAGDPEGVSVSCVAVKHNTPCGIALGRTLEEAWAKTYACDPVSVFGGVVACNASVDPGTAQKLSELFLEILVAPDFDPPALEILRRKKNLRIIRAPRAPREGEECVSVDGGLLVQTANRRLLEKWEVVTEAVPAPEDVPDMLFGLRAAAYVKSNAVVVVKDRTAAGIGGGETSRIRAAELALSRGAKTIADAAKAGAGDGLPPRVLASDAFFPFPDVVEAAAAAGIKTIVQPGGSLNDKLSVEACDRLGLAMVLTGIRHFKH
ncbi:MAG: bifunctional phosphoribosylaminoimidazolecarboxamide formyltransferase/IMP cyclohydrolase [Treponema sp.]|jgi:phosphoribosylaminoimidazolecarboxamide formyltransferase/IMP cyclohydrolase|nr:bifunctional phosphoribosylaminoimidazolecarboxamide formyltransferase/IMP cyclohydrolase [Treponema sp.]